MNKKLFVLICSLILFQYINNECTTKTDPETSEKSCDGTPTDTKTQECKMEGDQCKEITFSCTKITEGATDEICKKLKVDTGKVCKVADAGNNKKKCIVEDAPSNGANNLKYSLALLIFLFLF